VSGLIAPAGTPGQLLEAVRDGRVEAVVSWELAREIVDVLRRPSIRHYGVTEGDIDAVLAVQGLHKEAQIMCGSGVITEGGQP